MGDMTAYPIQPIFFTFIKRTNGETPQAGMGGLAAFLNLSPGGWGGGLKSAADYSEAGGFAQAKFEGCGILLAQRGQTNGIGRIALAQRIKAKTWRSIRQPENKKHASLAGKTCFLAQQPFQAASVIFQSCG